MDLGVWQECIFVGLGLPIARSEEEMLPVSKRARVPKTRHWHMNAGTLTQVSATAASALTPESSHWPPGKTL